MNASRFLWGIGLVLAPAPLAAQTVVTLRADGIVLEYAGHDRPCLEPVLGTLPSGFTTTGGGPCPALGAILPFEGDVAIDPTTDVVYATDGRLVAAFTAGGLHLSTFASPLQDLTGLGVDGAGKRLWLTDGLFYGAIALPPPVCANPVPLVAGPFAAPVGTTFAQPLSDLDWDAASGALVACDLDGRVGSFFPGSMGPGPYAPFQPRAPCPVLGARLFGIAVDRATPGTGIVFVTDGERLARVRAPGLPAPPTLYGTDGCGFASFPPGSVGLGFAGRQVALGAAVPAPRIGATSQSYLGNPAYTVTLGAAEPGAVAWLGVALTGRCPFPLLLGEVPVYLGTPRTLVAVRAVDGQGRASFTTPIPASVAPNTTVFWQWLVLGPDRGLESTPVGALTTIVP
jgi:hypothetical protein